MNLLKANALRRGDTIGIVAPAGPVDRQRIDRAITRLHQRGFHTKTYGDIYRSAGYLAGDDSTRAAELMAAFADPHSAAVWCARGGYGTLRLLHRLDFDLVRSHPKPFIGFSDITALHIALVQRTGLIAFHGPNLQDGFGKSDDMPPPNEKALWRALLADSQQQSRSGYEFDTSNLDNVNLRPLSSGVASGPLVGGNLAVLAGLMGTPLEIETTGRILFLEDVSERLYRLDRYLAQLRLAGKLQAAAGVLLGSFSYEEGEQPESPLAVDALLEEYFQPLGVPVLAGFPAGHAQYNFTLPMGATVKLDTNRCLVSVLENPVL
jgi:muramoyltetrapeptide carboxypeptidase